MPLAHKKKPITINNTKHVATELIVWLLLARCQRDLGRGYAPLQVEMQNGDGVEPVPTGITKGRAKVEHLDKASL